VACQIGCELRQTRTLKYPQKPSANFAKSKRWLDNLAITTPQGRYPESAVRVSKANVATRTSPKP
jgi:hypothetical protein